MAEIKQSINRLQVVGTLAEINLEEITKEVELRGANGTTKKVTCQQIKKKEWKNPSILVEVAPKDDDGNVRYTSSIGIEFFPTAEKKLDENGNVVDNPRFKAMQTIMNDYIPKVSCKSDQTPTRVKVDGSLMPNEYASSKDGKEYEFHTFPQVNAFQCTSTSVPDDDIAEGNISGVIRSIIPETKGEDAEETSRLKIELYSFDRNGTTTPTTFMVEEDLADDFADLYEQGCSCKLDYEIIVKQVGGQKKVKSAFGRRDSKMVSGFEVTEYSIFSGQEPFEEENEYFVSMDDMKVAMKERENFIDQKIADAKANAKEDKGSAKKSGLGNRASKVKETTTDDSDCPF